MMCAIQQLTALKLAPAGTAWLYCSFFFNGDSLPAPNMAAALTSAPFNSSLVRGGRGGKQPKSVLAHATETAKHVNE